MTILAFDPDRRTNAAAIAHCAALGYIDDVQTVLDVTYGLGAFWKRYKPEHLVAHDLYTEAPDGPADFTALPYEGRSFDVVVFDPPYKLNGTPAHVSDDRYGVGGEARTVDQRMTLIYDGCKEALRVADRRVLVKCQDQVVSGRKVWQTHLIASLMETHGWRLEDRLEVFGRRAQPEGRRQLHAHSTTSSLLVFVRGRR